MGIEECTAALIKFIRNQWIFFGVIAAPCLFVIVDYLRTKRKHKQCEQKRKKNQIRKELNDSEPLRDICVLVTVIVFTIVCIRTIPAMVDLHNKSYICVHGEYSAVKYKTEVDVWITDDNGEKHHAKTIAYNSMPYPQLGKHTATIWYGEVSGYLLYYVMDD